MCHEKYNCQRYVVVPKKKKSEQRQVVTEGECGWPREIAQHRDDARSCYTHEGKDRGSRVVRKGVGCMGRDGSEHIRFIMKCYFGARYCGHEKMPQGGTRAISQLCTKTKMAHVQRHPVSPTPPLVSTCVCHLCADGCRLLGLPVLPLAPTGDFVVAAHRDRHRMIPLQKEEKKNCGALPPTLPALWRPPTRQAGLSLAIRATRTCVCARSMATRERGGGREGAHMCTRPLGDSCGGKACERTPIIAEDVDLSATLASACCGEASMACFGGAQAAPATTSITESRPIEDPVDRSPTAHTTGSSRRGVRTFGND
jgi:hypothetical protein